MFTVCTNYIANTILFDMVTFKTLANDLQYPALLIWKTSPVPSQVEAYREVELIDGVLLTQLTVPLPLLCLFPCKLERFLIGSKIPPGYHLQIQYDVFKGPCTEHRTPAQRQHLDTALYCYRRALCKLEYAYIRTTLRRHHAAAPQRNGSDGCEPQHDKASLNVKNNEIIKDERIRPAV